MSDVRQCKRSYLNLITDEPVDEPAQKLAEALEAESMPQERFRALRLGGLRRALKQSQRNLSAAAAFLIEFQSMAREAYHA